MNREEIVVGAEYCAVPSSLAKKPRPIPPSLLPDDFSQTGYMRIRVTSTEHREAFKPSGGGVRHTITVIILDPVTGSMIGLDPDVAPGRILMPWADFETLVAAEAAARDTAHAEAGAKRQRHKVVDDRLAALGLQSVYGWLDPVTDMVDYIVDDLDHDRVVLTAAGVYKLIALAEKGHKQK
jgi:hypothetical protein